jgi:hypothetical protein
MTALLPQSVPASPPFVPLPAVTRLQPEHAAGAQPGRRVRSEQLDVSAAIGYGKWGAVTKMVRMPVTPHCQQTLP